MLCYNNFSPSGFVSISKYLLANFWGVGKITIPITSIIFIAKPRSGEMIIERIMGMS